MSPRSARAHIRAVHRIWNALEGAAPQGYEVFGEIDIVIDSHTPATVRVPDVVVVPADGPSKVAGEHVLLAVEVISPGTRRTDRVTKRSEYAEAGISHYWIVDLEAARVTALVLDGHDYRGTDHVGVFETTVPFEVCIDLNRLASPPD